MPEQRDALKLALPSKGVLQNPALDLLRSAGIAVRRPNERQYIASIPTIPQCDVLFQRASDIPGKVADGSLDLGITGYDVVNEHTESDDLVDLVIDDLGFGDCELVVAVPVGWIDVSSIADFADLTTAFRDEARAFRIATKYPNVTRVWLYDRGIIHFTLVEAQGTLEVGPAMGYAEAIVDITTSGTTLVENRLKRITGGTVLTSQACLIANRRQFRRHPEKLGPLRILLEHLEARLRALQYLSLTANVRGESPEAVARAVSEQPDLAGLSGPTVARVYPKVWTDAAYFAVTVVVRRSSMLWAVDHLRRIGGTDITAVSPDWTFDSVSHYYERFTARVRREDR